MLSHKFRWWSLSNLMWVHASQPHEWFLLWLRQKELNRWLAYKCHTCFREESFRRWRMKHGANRLNVRALRINQYFDTIIDIYFRAQELSNGFVGAAEASNLLPVATNFGFRIMCACVWISLTFHSCLQPIVFLLGRNNLQACTRTSIMACCLQQDMIKICQYCNQSVSLLLSFWTLADQKRRWQFLVSELWHNLLYPSAPTAQKIFTVLVLSKDTLASVPEVHSVLFSWQARRILV